MCCGQVYFLHEAHTWHHARGLTVMRASVRVCNHLQALPRAEQTPPFRSVSAFLCQKKETQAPPGFEPRSVDSESTVITSYTMVPATATNYHPSSSEDSVSHSCRSTRVDPPRSFLAQSARLLAQASARVSSKCLAHRGARTHDHKIKSLALCQLS